MKTTNKPLTEDEETKRGAILASMLNLNEARFNGKPYSPPRYNTEWGTKTALGLFRTVQRVIESGMNE